MSAGNGGPAFPVLDKSYPGRDGDKIYESAAGVSVRQYFAIRMMQSLVNVELDTNEGKLFHAVPDEMRAKRAIAMADALLAEFNKQGGAS